MSLTQWQLLIGLALVVVIVWLAVRKPLPTTTAPSDEPLGTPWELYYPVFGPRPWTAAQWAQIRTELQEKHAAQLWNAYGEAPDILEPGASSWTPGILASMQEQQLQLLEQSAADDAEALHDH